MVSFKSPTLSDITWLRPLLMLEDCPGAAQNFGNMYIWDGLYRQSVCPFEERALIRSDYGETPCFLFPAGRGDIVSAIDALRACCEQGSYPFTLVGLTEVQRRELEAAFPGKFEYEQQRDAADYIYLASRLATYSGKALHSKKNHCNRFEAEHKWQFKPLRREDMPLCLDMLEKWERDNADRLEKSIVFEHAAIERAFEGFEALGFEGGMLFADGELAGFTVGELASPHCVTVHFEKALTYMNGAYPMVCREFVRMLLARHPSLIYINREEDMGLEALRKSKLSYKPEFLLMKYTARWIDA